MASPTPLSRRIRAAIRRTGLSSATVARKCKVTAPAVSQWMSGRSSPSIDSLKRLARVCGVTVDALVGMASEDTSEAA